MNKDRSPGSSGFTVNFFKCFWPKLGRFVLRALNLAFETGSRSLSQKQSIIICIPKENKSKLLIQNSRPITLLNTVYKISSGSIANRIKSVLSKLVSSDQTGFLQGRFMGENTRL